MTVNEILGKLHNTGRVHFQEPCNCGMQIRHNNGGNYHQTVTIEKVGSKLLMRHDDTCELTESEPFVEVDIKTVRDEIEFCLNHRYEMW